MAQAFNAGNVPVKARKGQIGKYKNGATYLCSRSY